MLEKQKEWCRDKVEKGKAWIEDHKLVMGCAVGAASTVLLYAIRKKIMEPQDYMIETATNLNLEEGNFMMRVTGEDRFGKRSYHSPWVRYEDGDKDKERIDKAITAAINRDEPCEF
ncbi:hypothetical protein [Bacteroides sp.]|uniref:hypothetical protein n=1 Tax=Bacteroides sp. TaxID=29523 RepID=UPI0025846891|nr:hypothetical protein [Bacteroides sp.]